MPQPECEPGMGVMMITTCFRCKSHKYDNNHPINTCRKAMIGGGSAGAKGGANSMG